MEVVHSLEQACEFLSHRKPYKLLAQPTDFPTKEIRGTDNKCLKRSFFNFSNWSYSGEIDAMEGIALSIKKAGTGLSFAILFERDRSGYGVWSAAVLKQRIIYQYMYSGEYWMKRRVPQNIGMMDNMYILQHGK